MNENEVVPVGQKLYTKKEICSRVGWSGDQFDRRKAKYGFVPVVPSKDVYGGRTEALYDEAQMLEMITKREEEEEEARLVAVQRKTAEALDLGTKRVVFANIVDSIRDDKTTTGVQDALAAAAIMNELLKSKLEEFGDSVEAKDAQLRIETARADKAEKALRLITDTDDEWLTVQKFSQAHNLGWNRSMCIKVGLRAGKYCKEHGLTRKSCDWIPTYGNIPYVTSWPLEVLNALLEEMMQSGEVIISD